MHFVLEGPVLVNAVTLGHSLDLSCSLSKFKLGAYLYLPSHRSSCRYRSCKAKPRTRGSPSGQDDWELGDDWHDRQEAGYASRGRTKCSTANRDVFKPLSYASRFSPLHWREFCLQLKRFNRTKLKKQFSREARSKPKGCRFESYLRRIITITKPHQ